MKLLAILLSQMTFRFDLFDLSTIKNIDETC